MIKADRRNAAKVLQQKKRMELIQSARLFSGSLGVPKIVAVIPLCPDVDSIACISELFQAMDESIPAELLTAPSVTLSYDH